MVNGAWTEKLYVTKWFLFIIIFFYKAIGIKGLYLCVYKHEQ